MNTNPLFRTVALRGFLLALRSANRTKSKTVMLITAMALVATLPIARLSAQEFRYHYVSLSEAAAPPGSLFFDPAAINESGRVYGTLYDESFNPHVAVYENGVITVLQPNLISFTQTANAGGTIGGGVLTDPVNFFTQAALFHKSQVELIPRAAGEISSSLLALNDSGTALVGSVDASFVGTFEIYKNGHLTPINFGPDVPFAFALSINNAGIISGTTFSYQSFTYFGFRFDTRTGQTTLLRPVGGDSNAFALEINNRGNILGYSFDFNATERVGVWDRKGVFTPYFVEGTPQFPTISNALHFNDNNLIVISFTNDGTSYLVPKPGVRLDLADLVDNVPSGQTLLAILDINNHGDMIGFTNQGFTFLLQRGGATTSASSIAPTSFSAAKNGHPIPPAVALAIARQHTPNWRTFKPGSSWNLPLKGPVKGLPFER